MQRSLLLSVLLAACSSFSSNGESPAVPPTSDAGTDSGGDVVGGCTDSFIYVAPDGDDASTGACPTTPKKTFASAIARAQSEKLVGYEIHACTGTYEETIDLSYPISIRGGYGCTKFQRPSPFGLASVSTQGKPTFDTSVLSVVNAHAPVALRVSGSAVGSAVIIDGLQLVGSSTLSDASGVGASMVASVSGGASPVLENDVFVGAATTAQPNIFGSVTIDVSGEQTAPSIRKNLISGGDGNSTAAQGTGSVAVAVREGAAAEIAGNVIGLGHGTGAGGSVGIVSFDATKLAIASNFIFMAQAHGRNIPNSGLSLNMRGEGVLTVRDNRIFGASSDCEATGPGVCATFGILFDATGAIIDGNIVEGAQASAAALLYGIYAKGTKSEITNNIVRGGGGGPGAVSTAILVTKRDAGGDSSNVHIAHNTIATGEGGDVRALHFMAASDGFRVEDNLFLAGERDVHLAIRLDACPTSGASSVARNAFVGFKHFAQRTCASNLGNASADNLANLPTTLQVASGGGNHRVFDDCATDASDGSCVSRADCSTASGCLATTIDGWSGDGRGTLFDPGWRVRSGAPCPFATLGNAVPAEAFDHVTRTAPSAAGAYAAALGACAN